MPQGNDLYTTILFLESKGLIKLEQSVPPVINTRIISLTDTGLQAFRQLAWGKRQATAAQKLGTDTIQLFLCFFTY